MECHRTLNSLLMEPIQVIVELVILYFMTRNYNTCLDTGLSFLSSIYIKVMAVLVLFFVTEDSKI